MQFKRTRSPTLGHDSIEFSPGEVCNHLGSAAACNTLRTADVVGDGARGMEFRCTQCEKRVNKRVAERDNSPLKCDIVITLLLLLLLHSQRAFLCA